MPSAKDFFSEPEKEKIRQAIAEAEKNTLGEIRLYVEKHCKADPLKRAQAVFHQLKMDRTLFHTGVLIYLAYEDHAYAIVGDSGIHEKTTQDFWNQAKETMARSFSRNNIVEGLLASIAQCGEALKKHFPTDSSNPDELPNEIASGEA